MAPAHILVIDDDMSIRRLLRSSLRERGYRVSVAATGEEGLDLAATDPVAVVILDLGLPDMDGGEVCRQLRSWNNVPIIVLSARDQEMEKVRALDLGADDYLTKPFGTDELLARIRVALRHAARLSVTEEPVRHFDDLMIDLARRLVIVRGQEVHLTPREYELLRVLATQAGKVLTHRMLLRAVWGGAYEQDVATLRVFVTQLRRKIEADPAHPAHILTEPGIGYRFQGNG